MSDEMVTWLRARLDDDEQVARAATPGPWADFGKRPYGVEQPDGHMVAEIQACKDHEDRQAADAEHIARHDPARVLCEVEAKRRLLDTTLGELEWADSAAYGEWNTDQDAAGDFLRILALPYSDRDGYREEWRPE